MDDEKASTSKRRNCGTDNKEVINLTLLIDDDYDEEEEKEEKSYVNKKIPKALKKIICWEQKFYEIDKNSIYKDFVRGSVADLSDSPALEIEHVACRRVSFSFYRFETFEPIVITCRGIRVKLPNVLDSFEECTLDIHRRDVLQLITHFHASSDICTLVLYVRRVCTKYIEEVLGIKEHQHTVNLSPIAGDLNQMRRIVLELENISKSAASLLNANWPDCYEIEYDDAKHLLDYMALIARKNVNASQLLTYPPGKGGISITCADYACLTEGAYLNDVIIDFYMKWLHDNVVPKQQRDKVFMFSTFFYKRLTTITPMVDFNSSRADNRHVRVQKWTKSVNLFEKDFIFIPINQMEHWYLAVICFPGLKGPVPIDAHATSPFSLHNKFADSMQGEWSKEKTPIKQPLILIFDSLMDIQSPTHFVSTLRAYLTNEYKAKMPNAEPYEFTKHNMHGFHVIVPQQQNSYDCGLFVLEYVEQFFTNPITDFRIPLRTLTHWFPESKVARKREEIAKILQNLNAKLTPSSRLNLPKISFPTHRWRFNKTNFLF